MQVMFSTATAANFLETFESVRENVTRANHYVVLIKNRFTTESSSKRVASLIGLARDITLNLRPDNSVFFTIDTVELQTTGTLLEHGLWRSDTFFVAGFEHVFCFLELIVYPLNEPDLFQVTIEHFCLFVGVNIVNTGMLANDTHPGKFLAAPE